MRAAPSASAEKDFMVAKKLCNDLKGSKAWVQKESVQRAGFI